MGGADARVVRNTALLILALVFLRLVAAAYTPITFDEAYYWMWSKNLAGGYYDHPPMVAYVIRAVTMIASVGTLIVTPDAPLLVASSFVLFFLAKVLETGRGVWWLAVGAAVGA